MSSPEQQLKHAHPMPGFIAVAPIPEPEDPNTPCVVCGKVHPEGEVHQQQFGPFVLELPTQPGVRILRGIVLEIGELPAEVEHVIPYPQGATIHFTSERGTMIGGVLYMQANAPIAWDD